MGLRHHHNGLNAHVGANETGEFVRGDFAQPFEAGDLRFAAQFFDCRLFLGFVVAIMGFLFVADPEQRGLQDVDMAIFYQIGEELQEEGHQQKPDVHPVDIGVGGDDDLIVPEAFDPLLDIEGMLQEVEFFILIDDLLGEAKTV